MKLCTTCKKNTCDYNYCEDYIENPSKTKGDEEKYREVYLIIRKELENFIEELDFLSHKINKKINEFDKMVFP